MTPEESTDQKNCWMCKLGPVFGVLFGVVLIYISVDLMTDGSITRSMFGNREVTSNGTTADAS